MRKRSNATLLVFIPVIFFIDQIAKGFAERFSNVVCNLGTAFGVGFDVTVLSVVALTFIFLMIGRENKKETFFGLTLIFAGGFSNLIDRIFVGCVRDFINLPMVPTFNVADAVITLGVIVILYDLITERVNLT